MHMYMHTYYGNTQRGLGTFLNAEEDVQQIWFRSFFKDILLINYLFNVQYFFLFMLCFVMFLFTVIFLFFLNIKTSEVMYVDLEGKC